MLRDPTGSFGDWANSNGWKDKNGNPLKSKVSRLMDELNALMHRKGFEAAQAMKAYYMVHIGGSRTNETQEERNLRAVMECLQQEYKTLEHNLSSLQSTLRAEREAANDYSVDR